MFASGMRQFLAVAMICATVSACGQEVEGEPSALIDIPEGREKYAEVTRHYGPLVLSAAALKRGWEGADSGRKAWSSWWFPNNERDLFDKVDFPGSVSHGKPGALRKYDDYARKVAGLSTSAAAQGEKLYDPNAQDWTGRCHAWALASLMEEEPLADVASDSAAITHAGISFTRGDLKALLISIYEDVQGLQHFGQPNEGGAFAEYQDIYPDQFHRFVQAELFEKKKPFIVDKDPTAVVWSVPVRSGWVEYTRDPANQHRIEVTAHFTGGDSLLNERNGDLYNYRGSYEVGYRWSYDLYGYPQSDGSFLVMYGEWVDRGNGDASYLSHPDYVLAVPDKLDIKQLKSENREVDPALVYRILGRKL